MAGESLSRPLQSKSVTIVGTATRINSNKAGSSYLLCGVFFALFARCLPALGYRDDAREVGRGDSQGGRRLFGVLGRAHHDRRGDMLGTWGLFSAVCFSSEGCMIYVCWHARDAYIRRTRPWATTYAHNSGCQMFCGVAAVVSISVIVTVVRSQWWSSAVRPSL